MNHSRPDSPNIVPPCRSTTYPSKPVLNRRRFMSGSLLAGSLSTAAAIHGGFFTQSAAGREETPNSRIRIAGIGTTGRAGADLRGVASQEMVAIADVDLELLEKGGQPFPKARWSQDFRMMLEKEEDNIDAVVIGTPDHTHAPAAAMALRMGKHVYCEKPLTHTVYEARTLANLAREGNLVTQMGTQIHAGDNYRRVVEMVHADLIGPIRRVHVWKDVKYNEGQFKVAPQPKNLNWDLWLGPAAKRPYSKGVHPFRWRHFWDYGSGGLGDFGCHFMDLPHWALDLRHPDRVEAKGPPVDEVTTAGWLICDYYYPARGERPPVHLTWYDGGMRPAILSTLRDKNGKPFNFSGGQLFEGDNGMILSDYSRNVLLPADGGLDDRRPDPTIPASIGHHDEWLQAIRDSGPTTCNFDYSGALTEAVLLGIVAYRSGETVQWDGANLRVTNSAKAQEWIHREYRKGWTL
ncbi:MAG: Gfo/Idh/MocA family oxidoreductase [Pirellulaceae bacterium]